MRGPQVDPLGNPTFTRTIYADAPRLMMGSLLSRFGYDWLIVS